MPTPVIRDYFAELYVAARFGDAGWSVYFPIRDVGFDFIATKSVECAVIIRPVQVKGSYPTAAKKDTKRFGYRGHLTAVHETMVLALPYFHMDRKDSPEHIAYMPLDQLKNPTTNPIPSYYRCEPCSLTDGHAVPRPDSKKYFDGEGLQLIESLEWGKGA